MKQIIQSYKDGQLELQNVPAPGAKVGGLLVRNKVSLISPGTEKYMIEMGQKSLLGKARARPDLVRQAWAKAKKEGFLSVFKEAMNRLDEPIPLGYSAAGVVLEVGAGVTGFKPGDRVAAVGAGYASHAEVLWVPENLCVPIPPGVDYEEAAFGMLGAIALHGVRLAELTLGESAVVIGLGLLGLLSVQLLAAQGCRVLGVDLQPDKCRLALELGADLALVSGRDQVEEAAANFTRGLGADAVLICTASPGPEPVRLAEAVARERARLVLVGMAELSLTRKTFWEKELLFTVSKAGGPGSLAPLYEAKGFDYPAAHVRWTVRRNLEAFLDQVARGRVKLGPLITHRFPIADALQAYDLILKNREPYIGVLLTYPEGGGETGASLSSDRRVFIKTGPSVAMTAERQAVGVIGGGMFTRNILLPALKKVPGTKLVGAATTTGVTARHLAQKFGFAYATTDYREILEDPAIGSVLITTRHHSHARLVLEALAAGKHVFVEKPLCLTLTELDEIQAAYDGSRILMVGFNRRYAPLAQKLKAALAGRTTPLMMVYRINAGYIPPDHWVHDPEVGGGRLVGEVCHFIDFFHFLTDSEMVQVSITPISGELGKYRPDDNLCLTLTFRDGSVGTILYTAKGSKTFSRERLEVYGDEFVGMIEDFRRAEIVQGGRKRRIKKFSMDLGYRAELVAFLWGDNQINFSSYLASSRATLMAAAALRHP
ncbi:MAG: bi-domain-containing oxidoreductase [Syntrophobacterales bacterium]|nr:bi-domain-containing oxidoreductase [Syntrophobacterales bacterium]